MKIEQVPEGTGYMGWYLADAKIGKEDIGLSTTGKNFLINWRGRQYLLPISEFVSDFLKDWKLRFDTEKTSTTN